MDQSVERVLSKPEDLRLNPQHLQKKVSVVALACNPITGVWGGGRGWGWGWGPRGADRQISGVYRPKSV